VTGVLSIDVYTHKRVKVLPGVPSPPGLEGIGPGISKGLRAPVSAFGGGYRL
jgi:hypothetical protein